MGESFDHAQFLSICSTRMQSCIVACREQARAPKKKIRKRKKIETDEKDDVTVKMDPKVKKQLADMEALLAEEE